MNPKPGPPTNLTSISLSILVNSDDRSTALGRSSFLITSLRLLSIFDTLLNIATEYPAISPHQLVDTNDPANRLPLVSTHYSDPRQSIHLWQINQKTLLCGVDPKKHSEEEASLSS